MALCSWNRKTGLLRGVNCKINSHFKRWGWKKTNILRATTSLLHTPTHTHTHTHSVVTPMVTSCVSGTLLLTAERGGSPFHWVILYTVSQYDTKEQNHKGKASGSVPSVHHMDYDTDINQNCLSHDVSASSAALFTGLAFACIKLLNPQLTKNHIS